MNLGAFIAGAGNGYFDQEAETYRRGRQKVIDQREAERFAREQLKWKDEDRERTEMDAARNADVPQVADIEQYGVRPPAPRAPSAPQPVSQPGLQTPDGVEAGPAPAMRGGTPPYMPQGSGVGLAPPSAGQAPQQTQAAPNIGVDPRLEEAKRAIRLARTPEQLMQARQNAYAIQIEGNAAKIAHHVLNSSDEDLKTFAAKVSDGPNRYKIELGKDGMSTLKIDDQKFQMSRPQLAAAIAALYKMNHGDASAIKTLSDIDDKLADRAKTALEEQSKVVTTNNQGVHFAGQNRAAMINAGANAQNSATMAKVHGAQLDRMKEEDKRREQMAVLQEQYAAMTPEEQNGPKGIGNLRQQQSLNTKNGGGLAGLSIGGKGAALGWPLLPSACAILREMASFEAAGVSGQTAAA